MKIAHINRPIGGCGCRRGDFFMMRKWAEVGGTVRGVRIATPACGLVRNDRVFVGVRCVSAAAHMGAALQEITGRVRQIGRGRTPPLRIGWRCGAKGVRIATSLRSSQ